MVKNENSSRFERALTVLCTLLNSDIKDIVFDYKDEIVTINFVNGGNTKVNVNCDSDTAVVIDVMKRIF